MTTSDASMPVHDDAPDLVTSGAGPSYHRFVAIGDSWTEGLGDPDPNRPSGLRGWADRVAEVLATRAEDFGYANLAIRGRCVPDILDEQLKPALAMRPDLLSIQGGGNDLLHLRLDIDALVALLDDATARATEIGAQVVLFTHGTPAGGPFRALRGRIAVFNELLREVADARGAVLVDNWRLREAIDPRHWDVDRIHPSPSGHHLAALHMLDTLGVTHDAAPLALPEPADPGRLERLWADVAWTATFAGPWVRRRLTGRSLGDGISPKRPELAPV